MRSDKVIMREMARDLKLPIKLVEDVVKSQFEFTRNVIASDEDETVMLHFWGKYRVKKGRREALERNRKKRENDSTDK